MTTVISVENLSKVYRLGQIGTGTLSYDLQLWWAKMRGKPNPRLRIGEVDHGNMDGEDLWALNDISFEVKQGEVLGIIGKNGAGKSTLLKILSRITAPTSGRVRVKGRIASLLEVGTGFHPELTGRENTYLNGAILGMSQGEIDRKFDEIVDFSGVEKFIDTPVKRYSSGMYVRLAFAVAAHLEPEILLVDEVLAVGDVEFQKKCLGKLGDVAGEGRTVLFVSHNMTAVLSLCPNAYLLNRGRVVYHGETSDVISLYLESSSARADIPLNEREDRGGNGLVKLTSLQINNGDGDAIIRCGDGLQITLCYKSMQKVSDPAVLINIYDEFNRTIFFLDSRVAGGLPNSLPADGVITCVTEPINLTPGFCGVNIAVLAGGGIVDHIKQAITFNIEADDFFGTGKLPNRQKSLSLIRQRWQVAESYDDLPSQNEGRK